MPNSRTGQITSVLLPTSLGPSDPAQELIRAAADHAFETRSLWREPAGPAIR